MTLATIDPQDVDYIDYVDCGRDLAKRLREEQVDVLVLLQNFEEK